MVYVKHLTKKSETDWQQVEDTSKLWQEIAKASEKISKDDLCAVIIIDWELEQYSAIITHPGLTSTSSMQLCNILTDMYIRSKDINVMPIYKENQMATRSNIIFRPLSLEEANNYIADNHRHNGKSQGHKFSIGAYCDGTLVGVAMASMPRAPKLCKNKKYPDNPYAIEIVRLCTNGMENLCSMLYARVCQIATLLGYEYVYTFTLESEPGTSLRSCGFTLDKKRAGKPAAWNGKTVKEDDKIPLEYKNRWVYKCI